MNLLFQREQTPGKIGRVYFKLWGKLELSEDEKAIVSRYKFDQSVLIEAIQPNLVRNAALIGIFVFFIVGAILSGAFGSGAGAALGSLAGGASGYWFFNDKRETIYVKDLLHGRHFICTSVVELARKEVWLETVSGFLRQVMESATHWDGVASHAIEPLPAEEARQVILKGI